MTSRARSDARVRDAGARLARRAGAALPDDGADGWWAESAALVAAGDRARVASMRDQAAAGATLAGLFVDAAERGGSITVGTVEGTSFRGRVAAVGRDFVALRGRPGLVLVALDAVTAVRADGRGAGSAGDRAVRGDTRLADVLSELAADHRLVRVRTRGGQLVQGRLRAAGPELCAIDLPSDEPSAGHGPVLASVYVAVAAVTEVMLLEG